MSAFLLLLLSAGCGNQPGGSGQAPTFDGEAAYGWLQRQCDLGPRVPNTESHRQAQELFRQHFDSLGFTVSMQRFDYPDPYSSDTLKLVNIIAALNPEKRPRLLIGAHWECRPRAEHDPDPARRDEFLPGANDGASGTAVLLQLATHLHELDSEQGIDLVLFDGEDWGRPGDINNYLIGSREFARLANPKDYQYAIVLDMVGDKNQRFPQEGFSVRYEPDLVDAIWGRAHDLGLGEVFPDYLTDPIHDDHLSLLAAGIPAVDIIDFDFPYWHTTADTPDKCSAASLELVGQLMLSLIQDPI
ncbi:MAG: M28 family peptidase [bacterium]